MNVFRVASWPLFTITNVDVEEDTPVDEWIRDDYGDYYINVVDKKVANGLLKTMLDAHYQQQVNN